MAEIVPLTTAPIRHFSLSATARLLARPSLSVEPEDSLSLASNRFIQNGSTVLPVVSDDKVVGVLTGSGLAAALGDAVEPSDAVAGYMIQPNLLKGYATGAEALRSFVDGDPLVVVDDDLRLIGLLAPVDLFPRFRPQLRPALVGGMATPLGVYLTTGNVSAGVPKHALVLSGAAITGTFSVAIMLGDLGAYWLQKNGLSGAIATDLSVVVAILLFAALFRALPLSGIHGAEHQVVHAIERESELVPNAVKRMPLIHPRCGTNISVAFSLFLGVFGWEWTKEPEYRLIVAVGITLLLWRRLGAYAQRYITTKRPSPKQLEQAINAGNELLDKYAEAKTTYPSVAQRIWNSGLPFVLVGSMGVGAVLTAIGYLFHVEIL